jgi:hypothetical protein
METAMTETSNPNPTATITDVVSQIPEAARAFVVKATETGMERAARVRNGAEGVAATVYDVASVSMNGTAQITNSLMKAAHENVSATLGMIGKLANAKCMGDAATVQLDFVRDYGKANVAQVREIADIARKGYGDIEKAVRDGYAKVAPAKAA